jgi:hypothetical protein
MHTTEATEATSRLKLMIVFIKPSTFNDIFSSILEKPWCYWLFLC